MSNPFDRGKPRVWREEDGLSAMPKDHGAYRFVRLDGGGIDYIGITSNLYKRLSNHRSTKKQYDPIAHRVEYQVARTDADWDQLREWEAQKIGAHSPLLNRTRGGNGRVSTRYKLDGVELEVMEKESIEDAAERTGLLDRLLGLFRK